MRRTWHPTLRVVLGLAMVQAFFWSSCRDDGEYGLQVVFPSEELRQKTAFLQIWVVEIGSCEQLSWESLAKGEEDVVAHLGVVVGGESSEGENLLRGIPEGWFAFAAEGRTAAGAHLLRGCRREKVEAGVPLTVQLELQCACEPIAGTCGPVEETVGNGKDDDCDGKTDECRSEVDCDDGNGCTQDLCIVEQCQHPHWPDTTRCNDGNPCTEQDVCVNGVCKGVDKDCSAYDDQCQRGECDPFTGQCRPVPLADGTDCDDGLYCTEPDTCSGGICSGSERDCSDQDSCTRDECSEAEQGCRNILDPSLGSVEGPVGADNCSNGKDDDCDGTTDMEDGDCTACSSDLDCNDDNPCTADSCLPDGCENDPLPLNGSPCDDGLFCTEPDTCNNGVCSGPPHDCSDLNDACHDGVCDEESDSCVARQKQDGTACDDGLFCTVPDSCRSGSCTGPVRDCHDDDDCTQDVCDESEGTCLHVPQENPGAEGPAGSASCGNGIDDDCDGLTDTTDPDCVDSCGLRFDGVDDFVRVAQDRSILSSQQFGVLLDFTTGPMLTDWAVAAAQSGYSDDYPHNRWIVGFDPHDQRGLYLQVSNGEELLTLRDLVPLAECYNTRFVVLAVVNAASGHSRVWRYYQDSEQLLVDDDTFTGNINSVNVTYDLIVGDVANGNSPGTVFNATFREVAVFNYSEFTESDRQMLYTEPLKLKDYLLNGTDHGFSFPRSAVIDYLDFDVCNGSVLPNLGDPADGDGQLENFPSDGSQWIAE